MTGTPPLSVLGLGQRSGPGGLCVTMCMTPRGTHGLIPLVEGKVPGHGTPRANGFPCLGNGVMVEPAMMSHARCWLGLARGALPAVSSSHGGLGQQVWSTSPRGVTSLPRLWDSTVPDLAQEPL